MPTRERHRPRKGGPAARGPVRLRAPAKVNLRLVVLAREESGFHQLETLFCALTLADGVEVAAGGRGLHLDVAGDADLGPPEHNLVTRAAGAFFEAAGRAPAARIRLTKRIPVAAGLGGGSSDAAATLRALNRLHGQALGPDALAALAASLGSDVPFFLCGSSLALAWGRGDRLLPLPPLPSAPVLLAVPPFPGPTARAYAWLAEARAGRPESAGPARLRPPRDWRAISRLARNDFEPVVFERFPALRDARDALRRAGAAFALLAGSGSAVAGFFPDRRRRDRAARDLARRHPDLRWVRTATAAFGRAAAPAAG